jgi:hypothetical protein
MKLWLARVRLRLAGRLLRPFGLALYPVRDVARLQGEAAALHAYANRSGHLANAAGYFLSARHARRRLAHASGRIAMLAGELVCHTPQRIGA